jgi:simple sugar transport system ATP-binding protein
MAKGNLSPSIDRADATVAQMGEWMSGLWHEDVQARLAAMAIAAQEASDVQA